ncbi:hypothetical protein THASP1DRAFT_17716 [Thamnocephalis sphaerospora]|uniref:Peptidase M14 domain-containing protein n=1 Tax=Thamnocephalis sphaerospora TaxID=78915 RepID=A0A4P9XMB5_9FUNG|nr:hypothetical protein THASP1DRAFT_17716 [Thamnocephalis sphaerospora]|eukprot:RKP06996.1 hypothetical protein THASP1DRAFT_17716 [Thamnocephalis sphaerospora]
MDWHADYHRYSEILTFFQALAARSPDLVKLKVFGLTHEGRFLMRVTIGPHKRSEDPDRKRIWLQAMQHAREWISGATVQYIAESLVNGYGRDPAITRMLDAVEVVLVPVANPDGYEYSWMGERLWRKNRRPIQPGVFGVDMNRNWPDHWNNGGSSPDPRSDVYMGPFAASEPEVQALMNEFRATPNIVGAIDYHSYSQLLLYPVGYTLMPSVYQPQFRELGQVFQKAIGDQTPFVPEQSSQLYIASGGAEDWWFGDQTAKERGGRIYSICIELNPSERENMVGFLLPPSAIRSVGEEQVRGLMAFVSYTLEHPLL